MANEKRLIDIKITEEELKDIIHGLNMIIDRCCERYEEEPYLRLIEKLKNAPTVDAVEVVHGRWIPLEYYGYADGNPVWEVWECSECQEEHNGDEDTLTPYCPNCGAKMDGGNEDG